MNIQLIYFTIQKKAEAEKRKKATCPSNDASLPFISGVRKNSKALRKFDAIILSKHCVKLLYID